MKQRGRQSAASFAVIPGARAGIRLSPPEDLAHIEAVAFRKIVSACPPDHFSPSDTLLLVRYVEAHLMCDRAKNELDKGGYIVNGKASPWIVIQEKGQRAVVALSARLRLSPQSRMDQKALTRKMERHQPDVRAAILASGVDVDD